MNPEIKAKWLTALRSGEYRQGRNVLKQQFDENDAPQFCCLGVLCDIAIKDGLNLTVNDINEYEDTDAIIWSFDDHQELLPRAVMEWAGMDSDNPALPNPEDEGHPTTDIASLNDNGMDFENIADIIEREL